MMTRTIWSMMALSALLVGGRPESEAAAPQARPVRTVTIEKHEAGSPVTLTGRIEAKDEVGLGFRISGRLLENKAKLGDRVKPGEVIARLEPQNELNQLRSAEANLAAAQAQLDQTAGECPPIELKPSLLDGIRNHFCNDGSFIEN